MLATLGEEREVRRPDFFIVGAPKSGTTALTEYLRAHPDIFMPERKELHFFGTDLKGYVRDTEAYLSNFRSCGREKRCGEASVMYLYSKCAAEEIRAFSPGSSAIIMLRNPVEMMYSLYYQNLFNLVETQPTFVEALAVEGDRIAGYRVPSIATFPDKLFYRAVAKYTKQVERYLEVFGEAHVHVIIYDDFRKDTQGEHRKVLEFLGVEPGFRPELKVVNPNASFRSSTIQHLLMAAPGWLRSVGLPRVPRSIARIARQILDYNTKSERRPPLDPVLRASLEKELQPEAQRLGTLLGRDLSAWYPSS